MASIQQTAENLLKEYSILCLWDLKTGNKFPSNFIVIECLAVSPKVSIHICIRGAPHFYFIFLTIIYGFGSNLFHSIVFSKSPIKFTYWWF